MQGAPEKGPDFSTLFSTLFGSDLHQDLTAGLSGSPPQTRALMRATRLGRAKVEWGPSQVIPEASSAPRPASEDGALPFRVPVSSRT